VLIYIAHLTFKNNFYRTVYVTLHRQKTFSGPSETDAELVVIAAADVIVDYSSLTSFVHTVKLANLSNYLRCF